MGSFVFNDKTVFFDDAQEMREYVANEELFGNKYVVATNLGFDYNGLFLGSEQDAHFERLYRASQLIFTRCYVYGKQYCTGINERKTKHGKPVMFIDTGNYVRMSVDQMGKILNKPKLAKPKAFMRKPRNAQEWQELRDYNERDSRLSKEFMELLLKGFVDLGATPKHTIASTAMSLYTNRYLTQPYYRHKQEVLLEQFDGYYGANTHAYARGIIKNAYYYDFNSLYPSVMLNKFPDPNTLRVSYRNDAYYEHYEGMSLVTVTTPFMQYPLLPYRDPNFDKLIFPIGTFTKWYTNVELRRAQELGHEILRVHKSYYYKKTCEPFKDFVLDLYDKRMEYKQLNSEMELVVKLCMNGLYGKFGQKFLNKDNFIHKDIVSQKEISEGHTLERIGDFFRIKRDSYPGVFCFPIWAAYVTAYGRIKLHKAILRTKPVYVDTDSLMTTKKLQTSNKLGELKLEHYINKGLIVKPKFYYINELVKLKGVSKLTVPNFLKIVKERKARYKHFVKFKESLRRLEVDINEVIEMEKLLNLEDTKRWWGVNPFDPKKQVGSMPLCVADNKLFCYQTYDNEKGKVEYRITKPYEQGMEMHVPVIRDAY